MSNTTTITVRVAEHVPAGRRGRLVRNLVKYSGGIVDGDTVILPAEVWAQPTEDFTPPRAPGRYRQVPRGQLSLVSQGNLVVVE